jgi:hypothetical protein
VVVDDTEQHHWLWRRVDKPDVLAAEPRVVAGERVEAAAEGVGVSWHGK